MYGVSPGGMPDTYATSRMRGSLTTAQRPSLSAQASATWARLPIGQRLQLCLLAFGPVGAALAEKDWLTLTPLQRASVGATAREQARALV